MGRPVRLSGVGLRLLPRPGFVLHDLTVSEDPNFGAEPVLFARTVVASVGIFPLWRGKLQVTRVSVDEASLNLVRTAQGHWNLESLMMQAQPSLTGNAAPSGPRGSVMARHFPYLEATNSRVNLMRGTEKSPFSLVNTDLSLWQDQPGEWRVRLRGQPVRTDVELIWADTGEVRLEGSLHAAPQLRDMPIKLQAEWRDAQLGQLSRLLLGSDAGWRGDLTANMDVQGTADAAQTKARLRVTGVRREEFTPETALDLDANCALRYQHSLGAVHDLGCDTSIGSGKIHLQGDLPGNGGEAQATLEVKEVPLQAALDLVRTVRGGLAPGISAKGEVNGSLQYAGRSHPPEQVAAAPMPHVATSLKHAKPAVAPPPELNLKGSLVVTGGVLKGGQLKEALVLPTMTWAPVLVSDPAAVVPAQSVTLTAKSGSGNVSAGGAVAAPTAPVSPTGIRLQTQFTVPLGPAPVRPAIGTAKGDAPAADFSSGTQDETARNTSPISPQSATAAGNRQSGAATSNSAMPSATVRITAGPRGYQAGVSGSASEIKVLDLAYALGLPHLEALDDLTGGTTDFDVTAAGPWIPSAEPYIDAASVASASQEAPTPNPLLAQKMDVFSGTLRLHHAQWKASYLTRPADLPQATITLAADAIRVNADFVYGTAKEALKGTLSAGILPSCKAAECDAHVQLHFGALDASQVQAALLGPPEQKSILAPLVDRMRGASHLQWPAATVHLDADSLLLGPALLLKPEAQVHMEGNDLIVDHWEASALGGTAQGIGRCAWTDNKPAYSFSGEFAHLNPSAVAAVLGTRWKDGMLNGKGQVKLSGLNQKDLAASSDGDVQFEWESGTLAATAEQIHFSSWSGDATLHGGRAELGKNTIIVGQRTSSVTGTIPYGGPAHLKLSDAQAAAAPKSGTLTANPAVSPAH